MGVETIYRRGDKVKRAVATKDPSTYLVDKELLKQNIREYQQACNHAEMNGEELPVMPDSIGRALFQIATILSRKPYFCGYSWLEEMVDDAVLKCISSVRKFDTEAGTSAFAYMMQVAYYEFLNRLNIEEEEKLAKAAIIQNSGILFDDVSFQEVDADEGYHVVMSEMSSLMEVDLQYKKPKPRTVKTCDVDIFDIDGTPSETIDHEDTPSN